MDLSALTREELDALETELQAERSMRRDLDELRALSYRYVNTGGPPSRVLNSTAEGLALQPSMLTSGVNAALREAHTDGEEWAQPLGAHDAYAEGAIVTYGGKAWRSLVTANTWQPGVSGWREVTEGGAPAEWVRPSGAHDAYEKGDRVLFEGQVYESIHPGANTWSPTDYPDAWQLIEEGD